MKKILLITAYLLAELIMFSIYNGHKASFHWFTHYYVGAIVALLGLSIWKLSTHRSVVWPLGWLYLGHLLAMIPGSYLVPLHSWSQLDMVCIILTIIEYIFDSDI
jgi:hypothetical protein